MRRARRRGKNRFCITRGGTPWTLTGWREDCGPARGQGVAEGCCGFVRAEKGAGGGTGAHGGKVRAEFAGGDCSEQEEFAGAAELCAGDSACGRANRAIAGGTVFLAGGVGGGKTGGTRTSTGSGSEGGGEHRGVFLGAGEPAVDQETGEGGSAPHGRKARGQER